MEKFELDPKLRDEIRARVLGEGFMKIVQSVRRNGRSFRIAMRPVEIGGVRKMQAEMVDEGRVQVKNLDDVEAAGGLDDILSQKGARDLHLMTAQGDLHVRVTRKGHVLVSRSAELSRKVVVQPHDRVKRTPLASFDSAALLRAIGLADGEGKIRASMRGTTRSTSSSRWLAKPSRRTPGATRSPTVSPSSTAAAERHTLRSPSTTTSCIPSACSPCAS